MSTPSPPPPWEDLRGFSLLKLRLLDDVHPCVYCARRMRIVADVQLAGFDAEGGPIDVRPVCFACARRHQADIALRAADYIFWRQYGRYPPDTLM